VTPARFDPGGLTVAAVLTLPFHVERATGYASIYIGRPHPLARRSGQQRRARLIAMLSLNRHLLPSEHVHHLNRDRLDDRPANLEVVAAEYHGAIHCAFVKLTECPDGVRLIELDEPPPLSGGSRFGPRLYAPKPAQPSRRRKA